MSSNGNRFSTGPTIAVSSAGVGLAWCAGSFKGPKQPLAMIDYAIRMGHPVTVAGVDLIPGRETPMEALAALFVPNPGRTTITQAPQELIEAVTAAGYQHTFLTKD